MRTECGTPWTTEIRGAQEGNLLYGGQVPQPSIMGPSGRSGPVSEGAYQTLRGHLYGLYGATEDILSAKGSEKGVFVPGFDPMRYALRVAVLNDTVRVSESAHPDPFLTGSKTGDETGDEGGVSPLDSCFDRLTGSKTGDVFATPKSPQPDTILTGSKTGDETGDEGGVSPLDSCFCPSGSGISHGRRATGESL